jgi:hypothetical protein
MNPNYTYYSLLVKLNKVIQDNKIKFPNHLELLQLRKKLIEAKRSDVDKLDKKLVNKINMLLEQLK